MALLIGFVFPYISIYPFRTRGTPKLIRLQRNVQRMLKDNDLDGGNLLSKFLPYCSRFPTMLIDMVRQVLYFGQPIDLPPSSGSSLGTNGPYHASKMEDYEFHKQDQLQLLTKKSLDTL